MERAPTAVGATAGSKADDVPNPTTLEVPKETTKPRKKEVDQAVKLLELSQEKTDDPYYTVAIWKMIEGIGDSVKAAAKSILGW